MLVDNLSTSPHSSGEGGGKRGWGGVVEVQREMKKKREVGGAGLMKIITSTWSLPFGVILCSVLTASLGEQ